MLVERKKGGNRKNAGAKNLGGNTKRRACIVSNAKINALSRRQRQKSQGGGRKQRLTAAMQIPKNAFIEREGEREGAGRKNKH